MYDRIAIINFRPDPENDIMYTGYMKDAPQHTFSGSDYADILGAMLRSARMEFCYEKNLKARLEAAREPGGRFYTTTR